MGTAPPNLTFLLSQAGHVLETELAGALSCLGVSPRAFCVLSTALREDEITQTRLAELCALDKTTMVVTVDELERSGLAARRPSSTDRRARIIAVTTKGRTLVMAAEEIVANIHRDVLAALPAKERSVFVSALESLVEGRLSKPTPCDGVVRRRAVQVTG